MPDRHAIPSSSTARFPSVRRLVLAAICVLLLMATGIAWLQHWTGEQRFQEAIEHLRASGEPMSVEDVDWPAFEPESGHWLVRFGAAYEGWLAAPMGVETAPGVEAAPGVVSGSRQDVMRRIIQTKSRRVATSWSAAEKAELQELLGEASTIVALLAEAEKDMNPVPAILAQEHGQGNYRGPGVFTLFKADQFLGLLVLEASVRADGVAVIRRTRQRFHFARSLQENPNITILTLANAQQLNALKDLHSTLGAIGYEVEMDELLLDVERTDVLKNLDRAVMVSRARFLDLQESDQLRSQTSGPVSGTLLDRYLNRPRHFGSSWLMQMLAADERILAGLRSPRWGPDFMESEEVRLDYPDLPLPGLKLEFRRQLEAWRVLAIAALTSHASGLDQGERAARSLRDPYAPAPQQLSSRREADGSLLFWSLGSDNTDSRGAGDDIVWRMERR